MINELKIRFDVPKEGMEMLEGAVVLLENPVRDKAYSYPFSTDSTCTMVVCRGSVNCRLDLESCRTSGTGLLIILPTQVVENLSFSEDFEGYILVFSRRFIDSLAISDSLGRLLSVKASPFSFLEGDSFEALMTYVRMIRNTIRKKEHPHREEIVRLLTKAFCLGLGHYIHPEKPKDSNGRAQEITREFIGFVKRHCMQERELDFYAGKLFISTKHLSAMVRKSTGKSPSKWIEDYTILKAKQLLSNTKESVLSVSEALSFKSQSDFGKYFKHHTGLTPLEFRSTIK